MAATALLFLFNCLTFLAAESHSGILLVRLGCTILSIHLALNFARHQSERLLDVLRVLGGSLQKADIEDISEIFTVTIGHSTVGCFEILLVADENFGHILLRVLVYFLHPLTNLGERVSIGQVVGDDDTMGASIVA